MGPRARSQRATEALSSALTQPHITTCNFHPTIMLPILHEQHVASVHAQACVMLRKSAALYYT